MDDATRERIKQKVETAEARVKARQEPDFLDRAGERAIETKDRFTSFAREHPLTTVAGALAIGVLISGMFRNSPTRKLGRRAADAAATGAEKAVAYLQHALEAAEQTASGIGERGTRRLDHLGDSIGDIGRNLKRDGAAWADEAADTAHKVRHDLSRRARKTVRDLKH